MLGEGPSLRGRRPLGRPWRSPTCGLFCWSEVEQKRIEFFESEFFLFLFRHSPSLAPKISRNKTHGCPVFLHSFCTSRSVKSSPIVTASKFFPSAPTLSTSSVS